MNRRRFLALSAACLCAPATAHAATWRGVALGAEVSVTLEGPRAAVDRALAAIPRMLDRVEDLFSLYRPGSELSRLNRLGRIAPSAPFAALLDAADRSHRLTGGLFDPSVQPLWRALATGTDPGAARALIGWDRLRRAPGLVALDHGQALTFNGIAQGFATDLLRARLHGAGFGHALIDLGEQAAIGGPFRLGLADPVQGALGTRTLRDGCIATSSPGALPLGDESHILGPAGEEPLWSTISVEAGSATLADALSTAAIFMPSEALRALKRRARLHRITAVDSEGNLRTF